MILKYSAMKTRKALSFLLLPLCLCSCSSGGEISFRSNVEGHVFHTLYEDRYFHLDNAIWHPEIALPSYATAMATIRSDCDYIDRASFLLDLWEKEGFSSCYVSDSFTQRPGLDSVGYAFAHKEIASSDGPIHLYAITIRSGAYEGEWASNITLGEEGDAQGMAQSASIVYDGLLSYLEERAYSGQSKFWISGYSRGGSIANCLAGKLLDDLEEGAFPSFIQATKKDVYAYCFEPIACILPEIHSSDKSRYLGIKNILNFNDPVPHLIPSGWGFSRLGEDLYYPDRLTDIRFCFGQRQEMLSRYKFGEGGHRYTPYTVDEWKFHDVGEAMAKDNNLPRESLFPSIGRFARQLMNELTNVPYFGRYFYFGGMEPPLRALIAAMMGLNPDIGGDLISPSVFLDVLASYPFIRNLIFELQRGESGAFAFDISFLLYEVFGADGENAAAIQKLCDDLFWVFLLIPGVFANRQDLSLQLFSRDNLTKLFQCHYTELNYSFLRSCDPRLSGDKACPLNDGSYYLLHVDKAEDIRLQEERFGEVFTYTGGAMRSNCISAERLHDGGIDIYLPKNGVYSYRCLASSISLSNVDSEGNVSPLKENMPLQGQI